MASRDAELTHRGSSHDLPTEASAQLKGSSDEPTIELVPVFDSFFDVSYRIDFVSAPGSVLDGLSGSTVGRIGMVSATPPLFADGFESGDTTGWSGSASKLEFTSTANKSAPPPDHDGMGSREML
jgi:hypothetical protein